MGGHCNSYPCDAGVGLSGVISLARSSDRISLNNFPSIFFPGILICSGSDRYVEW